MIDNNKLSELVNNSYSDLQSELRDLHPSIEVGRFSGNYCSIYIFYDSTEKPRKVLRIWQGNSINAQQISHIHSYLEHKKLEYFAKCRHFDNALAIENNKLSVDVMDFIDGKSLVDHVEDCINLGPECKIKLRKLADDFKQMCIDLKKAQIAHGDLSGDNIMVTPEGKLRLIDYDSICTPELEGRNGKIAGHGAYNHPNRTRQPMSLSRDHFAEIVIYLTLVALCEKPELWKKYMPTLGPGEAHDPPMLIKESNLWSYERFTDSKIYKDLAQMPDQEVQGFLDMLAKALLSDGTNIPFPFKDALVPENRQKPNLIVKKVQKDQIIKRILYPLLDFWNKYKTPLVGAATILVIVGFGIKVISDHWGNDEILVEISQDHLVPSLEGSDWIVQMIDGERLPTGDAGATIKALDADGTQYIMLITSDSKALQTEVNFTVDRLTGDLLSTELGNGRVELIKDDMGNHIKIIFDKWIIVK